MNFTQFISLFKQAFKSWNDDKVPQLSAALSFYTLFSVAPLIIILLAITGFFFGEKAAHGQIVNQIQDLIGRQGALGIESMIKQSSNKNTNIIATIIGLITLIIGASGLFDELKGSLNRIWNIPAKANLGFKRIIFSHFLSFLMVIGVGFILVISLMISAFITALGTFVGNIFPISLMSIQFINVFLSFIIISFLFGLIFKFLPDIKITWRDTILGAFITGILFTLGKFLIGYYLGRSSTTSIYGAAGSLIIILLWTYYSSQIMFYGAEFVKVYTHTFGSLSKKNT